ncbi:UNVERIFIED_CONTAM: hypothetical protein FKN15_045806 [Acipenser sinensis]
MFCLCCLSAQVAEGFGECFVIGWLPCSHCALRTGMRERYSIPDETSNKRAPIESDSAAAAVVDDAEFTPLVSKSLDNSLC